ncbi:MAG: precorrin-2 C(20)-methyltransferase [Leptospirillia bacterium]
MEPGTHSYGTLYGVGLGPGDPELMTVKAVRAIERTKVLAVPVKARGESSFARAIMTEQIGPHHEVLELVFPMRSDPDFLKAYWRQAAETLSEYLLRGMDVAFLCEGDPFTFGTFIHVFRELSAAHPELPVTVVPGVTAYNAAAARTLTPLAAGDDRVCVLPATYGVEIVGEMLERFDTVVLLKVKPVMDDLLTLLEEKGLTAHAVFVDRVGTPEERVERDVSVLAGKKLNYLSLVIARNPGREKEPVLRGCRKKTS